MINYSNLLYKTDKFVVKDGENHLIAISILVLEVKL